jgi:hypothetical protein
MSWTSLDELKQLENTTQRILEGTQPSHPRKRISDYERTLRRLNRPRPGHVLFVRQSQELEREFGDHIHTNGKAVEVFGFARSKRATIRKVRQRLGIQTRITYLHQR